MDSIGPASSPKFNWRTTKLTLMIQLCSRRPQRGMLRLLQPQKGVLRKPNRGDVSCCDLSSVITGDNLRHTLDRIKQPFGNTKASTRSLACRFLPRRIRARSVANWTTRSISLAPCRNYQMSIVPIRWAAVAPIFRLFGDMSRLLSRAGAQ